MTIAMQKNATMIDVIQETETPQWSHGEMHVMMLGIQAEFSPDDDVGEVAKENVHCASEALSCPPWSVHTL